MFQAPERPKPPDGSLKDLLKAAKAVSQSGRPREGCVEVPKTTYQRFLTAFNLYEQKQKEPAKAIGAWE